MKKGKVWAVAGSIALAVLAAVFAVLAAVLPVTYDIDGSLIEKNLNPDVTLTEQDGFTTLVKEGGSFKVIGFTDLHLDHKQEKGNFTMEFLIRNIVLEKPDLVILDGDNFTSSFNQRRARRFAEMMEEMGIYWAFVLGNHEGDNFFSTTRARMVRILARYPHCLADASVKRTASGERVWGHGNYVINLADANGKVTQSLFFLDSGADMTASDLKKYDAEFTDKGHNSYDYVKPSQITWYRETVSALQALYPGVRSTLYMHIALPEFKTAYESITGETEPTQNVPVPGTADAAGNSILQGSRREVICHSGHNSGLFDAIRELGSTQAVFVGHDHINDFVLVYQGIILGYNEPSGYSSYNLVSKGLSDDLQQGYTRYSFGANGRVLVAQIHNCDLYPERQADVKALY